MTVMTAIDMILLSEKITDFFCRGIVVWKEENGMAAKPARFSEFL